VAERSKAWVCSRSPAGIVGSNPARGMDVCLLWVLCVCQVQVSATGWSLVQRSPTECHVIVCDLETSRMRRLKRTSGLWKPVKEERDSFSDINLISLSLAPAHTHTHTHTHTQRQSSVTHPVKPFHSFYIWKEHLKQKMCSYYCVCVFVTLKEHEKNMLKDQTKIQHAPPHLSPNQTMISQHKWR
jgi:hypothetical protein